MVHGNGVELEIATTTQFMLDMKCYFPQAYTILRCRLQPWHSYLPNMQVSGITPAVSINQDSIDRLRYQRTWDLLLKMYGYLLRCSDSAEGDQEIDGRWAEMVVMVRIGFELEMWGVGDGWSFNGYWGRNNYGRKAGNGKATVECGVVLLDCGWMWKWYIGVSSRILDHCCSL